jgi:hypothetical protein
LNWPCLLHDGCCCCMLSWQGAAGMINTMACSAHWNAGSDK